MSLVPRRPVWWLLVPASLTTPLFPAENGEPPVPLDTMVVSATRTLQDVRSSPHSVERLELPALEVMQIPDLRTALATSPGVAVATTGAAGGSSSIFMRGASSHQVSLFVDGVRMNDRSASYANFLGGADLAGLGRFEVLRGPQSTLYGSSAMGGVVFLESARGTSENPRGALSVEAGSFSTLRAAISAQGGSGSLGYSASLSRFETENDRPGNAFDQLSASGRLEFQPRAGVLVGGTVRWQQSEYEEPGSRVFAFPGFMDFENTLATSYAELHAPEAQLRSRLTVAGHWRDYAYADDFGTTAVGHTRRIVSWLNTWTPSDTVEIVGGLDYESTRLLINGGRTDDDLLAGFVSTTWRPESDLILHAGLRHDEFDSFGGATTGRAGVAWLFGGGRTKLRATVGTGFTAPGADDRFGVPLWNQLPNPEIEPEKSRGWDVGVDHDFVAGLLDASFTYFENRYRNLFEYEIVDFDTFAGMVVNRARATTRGAEFTARLRPTSDAVVALTYTLLEAEDNTSDVRLLRRPRHTLHLDAHWRANPAFTIGAGMHLVADRTDSTDAGVADIEDYVTFRAYLSYAVREDLLLKGRIENLFDETYEEVFGYPALPRAFYGSVEWRF